MAQRDLERRIADLRSSEPWTEDEARLVLDACEESGESVAAFARRMGLGAYRLFWWRKRLGQVAPAPAAFVPLVVREATSVSPRQPAAVLVRGSVRIELRTLDADSAAWAAALLRSPEDERACPTCGKERRCVCHERTEVIDLIPAEVVVRVDLREVLACEDCDAEMVRAPMGDKVVAGGAYGSRLVSELVVDKYRDGLPLHREHERLERLGLDMPSSSMADQIACAADLLLPIWRALLARILSSKVMHLDGTSLPVRDKDNAYAVAIGTLWGYVGDDAAAYLYTSTGKKTGQLEGEVGPEDLLAARHGYVVADAAGLFDASFKSGQRIEVGCNMHSRRRFVKALDAGDVRAAVPLAAYKALYDVEDAVREAADAETRRAERQRRSKPVYDELVAWCGKYKPLEPPNSLLGQAIRYQLNHHVALMRFLEDGALPIDNGVVERLHRVPAITRRNFLFAGSHTGGHRAAVAYSILAACDLADVNPVEYLADVLPRLARGVVVARDIPPMLPAAWKAARLTPAAVAQ